MSKFDFICKPLPRVNIKGGRPKAIRFAEIIYSLVPSAVVPSELMSRNKTNKASTLLHMTDENLKY